MGTGKDFVNLQKEKLNISNIIEMVVAPNCGAISNFIGITRDSFDNKKVVKLEYEAYETMAIKEMQNICAKIRSQFAVEHIAIFHRLGEVPVSEASVIIAISSCHRQDSLKATEYAIDALKASVPIWKKEIYHTDDSQWKENKECAWSQTSKEQEYNSKRHKVKSEETDQESMRTTIIDPNLVQIRASSEELNHRIESFIARKRQQVNVVNVQEFCCYREKKEENEDSCARVDAILIRRKDSKSHVKVHRVLNTWGPQTVDQSSLDKSAVHTTSQFKGCTSVLEDRISTTERILSINKPVPRDVYERLKNIEDRILYLEGVSPEYKDFWVSEDIQNRGATKPVRKRTFSMAELDTKLHELEDKYAKKIK